MNTAALIKEVVSLPVEERTLVVESLLHCEGWNHTSDLLVKPVIPVETGMTLNGLFGLFKNLI